MAQAENKSNDDQKVKEVPKEILAVIKNHQFMHEDDESKLTVENVIYLQDERLKIYATKFKDISEANCVLSVICKHSDNTLFERIIMLNNKNEIFDKRCECVIAAACLTDYFSPSGFIEYTFNENGAWYLTQICKDDLAYFRSSKFEIWKKMIDEPDCEASFKRLLNMGLINRVFGDKIFPSPPHEQKDWEVKNEKNGKMVQIPRACYALRCWNTIECKYNDVDVFLDGAPKDNDVDKYWQTIIDQQKTKHGAEYIQSLLGANDDKKKDE
eukprot:215306_1